MMKPLFQLTTLIACLLMLAATAHAQEGSEFEEETEYTFDGSVVEGQLVRPDGDRIEGGTREGASLIRIRPDFIPEMVRSVEEL